MINVGKYFRPESLDEALDLISKGSLKPLAGGTDLILELRHGKPYDILDIGGLKMDFIRENGDSIEIGTASTHSQISLNEKIRKHLPLLGLAVSQVGSIQIRNRGTVGGNIVNAAPCADSVPALLNYDAEVVLISKNGKRKMKLEKFITKPYETDIRKDELLYSIACKKSPKNCGYSFIKLGRRQAVNISRMTVAVTLITDTKRIIREAAVAGGSVFPTPARMPEIERALKGKKISYALFEEMSNLAAELMVKETGHRWSTPYKKPVLAGLVSRALLTASGLKGQ